MPASCSARTIALNSRTRALALLDRRIRRVRRKKPDAVVAPVIPEAAVDDVAFAHEMVHGKEFNRGHAERAQVLDRRAMAEPRVRAANLLGHVGVSRRKSLDVKFVDDRVGKRPAWTSVAAPIERRIDHDRSRNEGRAVRIVSFVAVRSRRVRKRGRDPRSPRRYIARAYGSSRSLSALHRCPCSGDQGPWTRNPYAVPGPTPDT